MCWAAAAAGGQPEQEGVCPALEEDGCVWWDGGWEGRGVQPLSLQPQELLYCWGEAGPAPTGTAQAKAHVQLVTRSVSVDSTIVRLCTPVRDFVSL